MAEDVFAGIETAPATPAVSRQRVPLPPPPASEGHRTGIVLAMVGFVLLLGAGGATWWYFFRPALSAPAVQTTPTGQDLPILPPPAQELTSFDSGDAAVPMQIVPLPEPVTTPPPGTSIPLPGSSNPNMPVMPTAPDTSTSTTVTTMQAQPTVQFDTDGDGLTDAREQELGTNASKLDTDGDTLGDGQEVMSYSTNPLNSDTDSDGFPDGVEIQNGFNPRGTGRCSQSDCRL